MAYGGGGGGWGVAIPEGSGGVEQEERHDDHQRQRVGIRRNICDIIAYYETNLLWDNNFPDNAALSLCGFDLQG